MTSRVTDIAAAAGVSHGSFYTYFDSKTDIFRALVTEVMEGIYTTLGTGPAVTAGGDFATGIRFANRRFIEIYEANAALMALFEQVTTFDPEVRKLRLRVRSRMVERISRAISRRREEGLVRAGLDPHCTASALVAMTNSITSQWLVMGEEFDREVLLQTLDQIWLSALGMQAPDVTGATE